MPLGKEEATSSGKAGSPKADSQDRVTRSEQDSTTLGSRQGAPVNGPDGASAVWSESGPTRPARPVLQVAKTADQFLACSKQVYRQFAGTKQYFHRSGTVWEIRREQRDGAFSLGQLDAATLVSRLCEQFTIIRELKDRKSGEVVKVESLINKTEAEVLLKAREVQMLPNIRLIANAPLFSLAGGELVVLGRGYHRLSGGVQVVSGLRVQQSPPLQLGKAVERLLGLLAGFKTASEADRGRAVAALLAPAFIGGGLIKADVPLFVIEADQSQTGKSYLVQCIGKIYNETPYTIVRRMGGVGSYDESIATAMLSGRQFCVLENVRGEVNSQLLEAVLSGQEEVALRTPHAREVSVPRRGTVWFLTSNGVLMTEDLKNRSLPIQLRKQDRSYEFPTFAGRPLHEYVTVARSQIFGAFYTVLHEWVAAGCPRTATTGHSFRDFVQPLDWVVQSVFGLPPLLQGVEQHLGTLISPVKLHLRALARLVEKAGRLDQPLRLPQLVEIVQRLSGPEDLPSLWLKEPERLQDRLGREVLHVCLPVVDQPERVDEYRIVRTKPWVGGKKQLNHYTFQRDP